MTNPRRWKALALSFPLVVLVCFQLFPVLLIVLTSFKSQISLLQHGPFGTTGFFLGNYTKVIVADGFMSNLGTSLMIAMGSTAISVAAGALAAYALTRFRFTGSTPIAMAFLCARVIPPVALAIPLFLLLKKFHLTDSVAGLVLAHTTMNLPFAVWLIMPFFDSLPKDYEEAAEMDGCTQFQVFHKIFLPMALPGLLVAGIFCFLLSWNDFLLSLILAGSDTKTAPLVVNAYMTGFGPEWGPMTASSVVILVPVFIFSLALQKHMVSGISAGGVKG